MTNVSIPFQDESRRLNDVALTMIENIADPDNTKLRNYLTVKGPGDVYHDIPVDQLVVLAEVMRRKSDYGLQYSPITFLLAVYQLSDMTNLAEAGWVATAYKIQVATTPAGDTVAILSGTLQHSSTLAGHPNYDAGATHSTKAFEFTLHNFDIVQQMALSHIIARVHETFAEAAGTFGVDYIFECEGRRYRLYTEDAA